MPRYTTNHGPAAAAAEPPVELVLPGQLPREMYSNRILAAGGLRMMARHLAEPIDTATAHRDRLNQVADDVEGLLFDAIVLSEREQHDSQLERRIRELRAAANRWQPPSTVTP